MRIEMRQPDARRSRAIDLRAQLAFDLLWLCFGDDLGFFERQIAVSIEERGDRIDRTDRTPPISGPLTVHRQMNAEVRVRMRRGKPYDLREPRTRHEDARRGDPAFFERLERRAIDGVRH